MSNKFGECRFCAVTPHHRRSKTSLTMANNVRILRALAGSIQRLSFYPGLLLLDDLWGETVKELVVASVKLGMMQDGVDVIYQDPTCYVALYELSHRLLKRG